MTNTSKYITSLTAVLATLTIAGIGPAHADRIENNVAVFAGLDKVTARISAFEVKLGETVQFGTLRVTPQVCYSRPATEQPKTTTFVEVDEVQLDGTEKRLFAGWMFAESPGLHGVEHPTVDVWLTDCKEAVRTTSTGDGANRPEVEDGADPDAAGSSGEPPEFRRRIRR